MSLVAAQKCVISCTFSQCHVAVAHEPAYQGCQNRGLGVVCIFKTNPQREEWTAIGNSQASYFQTIDFISRQPDRYTRTSHNRT